MSTPKSDSSLEDALGGIAPAFQGRLLQAYNGLKAAFLKRDFDACGLRAGRFCEVVLRLVQDRVTGTYIPFGSKIPNFSDEAAKLEQSPKIAAHESLRVLMPRALNFLYTLRNKRGIGHEGGDVDANQIDAATAARIADWCVSELIRLTHNVSLEEAQAICDAVADRDLPQVWEVFGKKRVMNTNLSFAEETLLLLYSHAAPLPVEDLVSWTEYSNAAMYRKDVLRRLHTARLIEYDRETEIVAISPLGVLKVENGLLVATTV